VEVFHIVLFIYLFIRTSHRSCQWLSPVTQTKSTQVHFKTREPFLASVAACVKTPALPPNLIIQWIEFGRILGPLIISDEVKAI